MILSDTDILSAMAKVGQLELLYRLFAIEKLYIVPAVFQELDVAHQKSYRFAASISEYVVALTQSESALADELPGTLGAGERESLAVARIRNSALLCNESRVKHWSRQLNIVYFDVPLILRALWTSGVLSQDEVRQLILDLYEHDRMNISVANVTAIFAPLT